MGIMNADPAVTKVYEELDLLIEDFIERSRSDSCLSIDQYASDHPQWQTELRELLPAAIALEASKRSRDFTLQTDRLPKLPDYRFIEELGRGGMGIVYKAEHAALGRLVAVKILSPQLLPNAKARERFQREAKATARLHHTNIVPVFEVGQSEDVSFYSMQLIEGKNLDELIRQRKQQSVPTASSDEIAKQVIQQVVSVARALQYAHDNNILHRDIKPSNVLIDTHDQAWLSDFGLASISDEQTAQSQDIVGTLRYLAPERLTGQCDVRSDVYSLGLTLYECFAMEPALGGVSKETLLSPNRKIPSIVKKLPSLHTDLATIIDKSMRDEPESRYQTAGEFADDLEAYSQGKPIAARRVSQAERLWMWSKRNPSLAAMIVSMNLVLIAIAIGASIAATRFKGLSVKADNARNDAVQLATVAQKAEAEAKKMAAIAQQKERAATQVANFFSRMIQGADPTGLFTGHSRSAFSIDEKTTAFKWIEQTASMIEQEDFTDSPLVEAQLKDTLGVALTGQMRMNLAKPLLERSLALRRDHLPSTHRDLAASYEHWGTYNFYSGNPQQAAQAYHIAFDIWQKIIVQLKSTKLNHDEIATELNAIGSGFGHRIFRF
jgi:serine/threonine protein kinase